MPSAERSAFLAAAASFCESKNERSLLRLLRSPLCGVPHEISAAYAAVGTREGGVLEMLLRERIAAAPARDAVLAFGMAVRRARDGDRDALTAHLPPKEDDRPAQASSDNGAVSLADPVEPEPGMPVAAQNPRFSASQLNTYVECARKWFYRYVCAAVEDKGSSASFYGTAFHAALEDFHAVYPQPGAVSNDELQRKIGGYINAAFERYRGFFETPVEYELQLRRARRTAQRYARWLWQQAERAPFTVVGCELPAELQLDGFDFIGYIDRLDRDDRTGNVAVIDYKTGSIATSATEYREKVRTFRDFQLPFYYWARTAQGDRVSRLALIPLKDALLDVRPIELEVVPVAAEIARSSAATGVIPLVELERARTRMVEICRELTAGTTTRFPVAGDPEACTYCAYTLACSAKPNPGEARFAR